MLLPTGYLINRREEKRKNSNNVATQPVKINHILILEVMNERTCFALCARVLKSSGWSLVCIDLLTKKVPTILLCLNEISRGCER